MGQSFDPFLLDFFFRDILANNQKQKFVTLASAQEYCRRFQGIECKAFEAREACVVYPSNDRLLWPVTFPCFVIKACRRVSTNQTLYTNVQMNESKIEVNILCGCKARKKVSYCMRPMWAIISSCVAPDPIILHLVASCSNATLKQFSNSFRIKTALTL